MHPPLEDKKCNQLFAKLIYVDRNDGTMYTNLTWKFPIRSTDGMTVVFVLYDWMSNAILAAPLPTATYEAMIEAFKNNVNYLSKRGFKPKFNVMDNGASKAI